MSNHPAVLEILFGCWSAGLAVVPINPKLHPREADYILAHSQASLAFTTADIGPALAQLDAADLGAARADLGRAARLRGLLHAEPLAAPVDRRGDDLAWLFYTSGTTGRPKGVMITHRNLMTMTLCYFSDVDTVRPERRCAVCRADVARRRPVHPAARAGGCAPCGAAVAGLRRRRGAGTRPPLRQCLDVCRADHGAPPGRPGGGEGVDGTA